MNILPRQKCLISQYNNNKAMFIVVNGKGKKGFDNLHGKSVSLLPIIL